MDSNQFADPAHNRKEGKKGKKSACSRPRTWYPAEHTNVRDTYQQEHPLRDLWPAGP